MKKHSVSLPGMCFRAILQMLKGNPAHANTRGATVNKAILAILAGGGALSLIALVVVKAWAACEPPGSPLPTEPYVCVEMDNYNPGETANITGVAFQPGETIELIVLHADDLAATGGGGHEPWQIVADAYGNFETTWHVCEDDCAESVLVVTATGLSSGLSSQAFFTDATTLERSLPCAGMSESFNSMGSGAVVLIPAGFTIDSTSATSRNSNPPKYNDATNSVNTTQSAGTTGAGVLTSTSSGGMYNFGNGTNATATDRALGVLNSGSFGTPRTIMFGVSNTTATVIQNITISWNYEKYRSGSRIHIWTFFSSADGINWTSQTAGDQSYAADANNTVVFNPPQQIVKTITLMGVNIPADGKFYFRWSLTGVGGTPSSDTNGQGLGIDDVTVTPANGNLTATCQSITRLLGSTSPGTVMVNATEINNGSGGSCGPLSFGIRKGAGGTFGSSVSFDCSEIGANTVELQVADQGGNSATCTATVTVRDTTAPLVTCAGDQDAVCNNGSSGAVVNYPTATAIDSCEGAKIVTCTPPSGSVFPKCTTTVTCSASDSSGNTGSCKFLVTVRDAAGPVVTCPPDQTAECNNGSAVVKYPAATAIDVCEGVETATCTPPSGSTFVKGATTVTCSASDSSGNTGSCQFTVTVRDTTAPAFNNCPSTTILSNATLAADDFEDGSRLQGGATDFNWFRANIVGSTVRPQLNIVTDTILGSAGNKALQLGASSEGLEPAVGASGFNLKQLVTIGDTIELSLDFHLTGTIRDSSSGLRIGLHNSNGTPVTADQTQQSTDDFGYYISIPTGPTNRLLRLNKEIGGGPGFEIGGNAGSGDVEAETAASTKVGNSNINDTTTKYTFRLTITKTAAGVRVVGRVDGGAIAASITFNDNSNPFASFDEVMINENDGQDYVIDNVMVLVPVECNSGGAVVTYLTPTATDACEGAETVTCVPASGSTFPVGNSAVTCTAVDSSGNTSTCSFTVVVPDTTAPVVTCPGAITKSNDPGQCSAVVTYSASASDACEGALTPTCNPPSGSVFPAGTTTVTCTASDSSGNSGSCEFTVTVKDAEAPVLTCPPNKTVECPGDTSPTATGQATVTDNCGSATVTSSDSLVAGCGNTKTITRTWTAIDSSGNTTSCTQIITVVDTTAPAITAFPADAAVQCASVVPAADDSAVSATDNCGGTVTVTHDPDVISNQSYPNRYTITRTYHATDSCGNSAARNQTITVNDTTAPTPTCPQDKQVACGASTDPSITGVATATDNCGGPLKIEYADTAALTNCTGQAGINRIWTAFDGCGNSATCTQHITFVNSQAPQISGPADKTVESSQPKAPSFTGSATATVACGAAAAVTYSDSVTPGSCPKNYTITRTWTATDACGNSASSNQTITVRDTTPPTTICRNVTAVIQGNGLATVCASDVDNGSTDDGDAPTLQISKDGVTFTDCVTYGCNEQGTHTITLKATDSCGNSSTCTATVMVTDPNSVCCTAVSISCPGASTIECGGDTSPTATGTATAQNGCPSPLSVTVSHQDSMTAGCGNAKTIVRHWKATDGAGNTATCDQTITVNDTTAPVLSGCPANTSYQCIGQAPTPATVTANDNCDGAVTPTFSETQSHPGSSCNNVITRTWTATDGCGNTASCTQTITVNDTTTPSITCPSNMAVTALPAPNPASVAASDNCGTPTVTFVSDSAVTNGCQVVVTRRYKATDTCGNSSTCTQTITVQPTINPADCILWHQPLARNGMSDDTDPSAGGTLRYPFKSGSTIPIQIRVNGCATADVTSNPNVTGKVEVFADFNCDGLADAISPIDYNGVGEAGGYMDRVNGFLKYNLDSKALVTSGCYVLRVTVTDTSTGQSCSETVLLQRR